MFVGMTVVSIAFVGFVFAAENQATVRRFRRNHPYVCVMAVLLASYLFMSVLGGVAVFLFGIAFPVLSKSETWSLYSPDQSSKQAPPTGLLHPRDGAVLVLLDPTETDVFDPHRSYNLNKINAYMVNV